MRSSMGAETNATRVVLILETSGAISSKQWVALQQTRCLLLLVLCGFCMTAVRFLDLQWAAVSADLRLGTNVLLPLR